MKMTGNTILITGGGSGIGLALAEEFRKLDNEVIVAARSEEKLKNAKDAGFNVCSVDMTSLASIQSMAREVTQEFPSLNVIIQNAGVMKTENLLVGGNTADQVETINTNLLGPMRLNEALLPHFLKQKSATIMTVTSGLAFLPLASTPTYCASKAALHSYTQSLRYQLKDTQIGVIELAPPYVQTFLTGARQAHDPHAMPLREFIQEVMQILNSEPSVTEILVKRVMPLRFSSDGGHEKYEAFYKQFNDSMALVRSSN